MVLKVPNKRKWEHHQFYARIILQLWDEAKALYKHIETSISPEKQRLIEKIFKKKIKTSEDIYHLFLIFIATGNVEFNFSEDVFRRPSHITALMTAVHQDNLKLAKLLVEQGKANVNEYDFEQYNTLMFARSPRCATYLLDNGAKMFSGKYNVLEVLYLRMDRAENEFLGKNTVEEHKKNILDTIQAINDWNRRQTLGKVKAEDFPTLGEHRHGGRF